MVLARIFQNRDCFLEHYNFPGPDLDPEPDAEVVVFWIRIQIQQKGLDLAGSEPLKNPHSSNMPLHTSLPTFISLHLLVSASDCASTPTSIPDFTSASILAAFPAFPLAPFPVPCLPCCPFTSHLPSHLGCFFFSTSTLLWKYLFLVGPSLPVFSSSVTPPPPEDNHTAKYHPEGDHSALRYKIAILSTLRD